MEKILVTGKDGFFASRFIQNYKDKYNIIGLGHNDLDILILFLLLSIPLQY
jgi:dTDP-4-dehydrorhamnose reductase